MNGDLYQQHFSGELCAGFVGHIRYQVVLPEEVKRLNVGFTFSLWTIESSDEIRKKYYKELCCNFPAESITEEMIDQAVKTQKSEINLSLQYDGIILGSMHYNSTTKNAVIGKGQKTRGLIPIQLHGGCLDIILHCVKINNNHTKYELVLQEEQDVSES